MTRSSSFAAFLVAVAGLGAAACASLTPAPVFSKDSPADPRAPAAPASPVERLGEQPPASQAGAAPGATAQPSGYACPMHPDVKSDRPGSCPRCGMRLVEAKPGSRP